MMGDPKVTMMDSLEAAPDRPKRLREIHEFAFEVLKSVGALMDSLQGNPLLALAAANLKDPYPDATLELLTYILPEIWMFDDRARFRVVRGMLVGVQHLWFAVEVPGMDVGDVVPWWRYIIDPRVPGARPGVVLLEPGSALQLAYVEGRPQISGSGDGDRT